MEKVLEEMRLDLRRRSISLWRQAAASRFASERQPQETFIFFASASRHSYQAARQPRGNGHCCDAAAHASATLIYRSKVEVASVGGPTLGDRAPNDR